MKCARIKDGEINRTKDYTKELVIKLKKNNEKPKCKVELDRNYVIENH